MRGRWITCARPRGCPGYRRRAAANAVVGRVAIGTAGRVWNAPPQLQSLGEDGVVVTPASLALAYCRLASRGAPAVLAGMADAVEFGTAQRARVTGLKVAGKTGSVRTPARGPLGWFAGFTDGAVVTVMLQAKSGGADAAPIAGRILEAHWKGRL